MPSSARPDTRIDGAFPATRWTLVNRACSDGADARTAIEDLCNLYWFPIYAYVRCQGATAHDAEDLTQGFFQKVLDKGLFQKADQDRGKLRSFLLTILKRYISNTRDSARAQKRGGGVPVVSIDVEGAENLYASQVVDCEDPEKIYFRAWAHSLIDHAREKLRVVYEKAPYAKVAAALETYLDPNEDRVPYQEMSERFAMKEGTLRLHVHRMRHKLGDLLKEEVLQTVDSPEELPGELDWLKEVMQAG